MKKALRTVFVFLGVVVILFLPGYGGTASAGETNCLCVSPAAGSSATEVDVVLNLTSEGQVGGMQFDLTYDSTCLTFKELTAGNLTDGFSISGNNLNGTYRVIIYSLQNKAITEGTGSVAILSFTAGEDT